MNIFLAIMTVIIFLLTYSEKNDVKRKHLTWCYAVTVVASLVISIVKIITTLFLV